MADLGFLPVVRRLLSRTPAGGQRMLFSATLDKAIDVLVRQFLNQPKTHQADSAQATIATMSHHVLHVRREQRIPVLVDLTSAPGRKVVFTRTKHGAKALARQLNRSGIPTVDLHGNLSQGARTRNMEAFHSGRATTLVATDVAARGIHVDDVSLVVHADPPSEHKAYLHRSGRTARAGAEGTVVTLMTDEQVRDVRALTRAAGIQVTTTKVNGVADEVLRRLAPGTRSLPGGFAETAPAARSTPRNEAAPRPCRRGVGTPAASGPSVVRWPQPGPSSRPGRPRSGQDCSRVRTARPRSARGLADRLSGTLVHHVRVARCVREAELLVEMHCRRVVRLDVQQDLFEPQRAQVCRPQLTSVCPRPRPWAAGSIATTYTSPSVAECRLVQWKPCIRPRSTATNRSAGSNHGSAIRSASSVGVHRTLLGVVGERCSVDAQQLRLVALLGTCGCRCRRVTPRAWRSGRRAAFASPTARVRARTRYDARVLPRPGGRRATRPATGLSGHPGRRPAAGRRGPAGDGPETPRGARGRRP